MDKEKKFEKKKDYVDSKNIFQKKTYKKENSDNDSDEHVDKKPYAKNGYERPSSTFTEQLSKEQINERLVDYVKVEDLYKVPLGVHLRYFVEKNGEKLFRMGGQLYKNTGLPDYVILNNGKTQWSVQVNDSIFYRKMTINEIKEDYEKGLDGLKKKYEKLKEENKNLKEKLKKYEK